MLVPPQEVEKKPKETCIICRKAGQIKQVELLPHNGVLLEAVHEDGSICEWGEYNTLNDIRLSPEKSPYMSKIVCPICNKTGRIEEYRTDPNQAG